ncbi:MAG: methionine--tRNA ligase [Bacteroidetes bacterium GWF2_43_63]|nr:MAG: methionine--tRNA ligase [Bacteroidetes bacterium GWE2_42_42]OFY52764.1 MAG: methionine--tRNA ligase [Bacteroidetes bacterium GWF2_43_63]HBG70033.1 methionine--tRNA ligase [Bacteroidales bacterium]HCB62361.1 methionine--tRNA ligase [Bacteroidales bacterium]HCY22452.1 methionine--tRNA ligase [Bacteroidales bacterium]
MKDYKRYTVTTALPYANGPIHIGHMAGVYVPADIYVRFLRKTGRDVLFIGGSDEHGVPITIKARQKGITPQQVVDEYHGIIKKSFEDFGMTFDIYSRTSLPIHHETASAFFTKLHSEGKLTQMESEQYFDEEAQQFLADRYITGTCPHCGNERAYGDQCEKCGTSLNATDLIDPKSTLSGSAPVKRKTSHWFLPLDQYENWLREWILDGHKEWKTNVYGQCKSWIDQGLQPRAVTRDLDWGVKVPLADAAGKVLYVWFDAPIGYISAARDWAQQTGKSWEEYWKSDDSRLIHFIGKDNIVFHCIIFPAMLKAEGSYILPENVPANEFLNLEGEKISTSRNWAVWLHEYLEDFPGKQDVLRYVLTANAPETKDNDFTWKDFQARNNNELASIFGNFVNRAMVLTHKYFEGKVPASTQGAELDDILKEIGVLKEKITGSLEHFRFREALGFFMDIARIGNKYLTDKEPWKVFKENPEAVKGILNNVLQISANMAILSEIFLPFTATKLKSMLNMNEASWDDIGKALLNEGLQLNQPELLFEKIDDADIQKQLDKLEASKIANKASNVSYEQVKPDISFDDFSKIDLRVGKILEAEKVAKTKKLMKLSVDMGFETRTIVSGVAEYFTPEQMIGKKVVVVANLGKRDIKGVESNGMILFAENSDGTLMMVNPSDEAMCGGMVK